MDGQILKFVDLANQYKCGLLDEDQIEALFGMETLNRILEHWQEELLGTNYA